jgi:hypothetical protein
MLMGDPVSAEANVAVLPVVNSVWAPAWLPGLAPGALPTTSTSPPTAVANFFAFS